MKSVNISKRATEADGWAAASATFKNLCAAVLVLSFIAADITAQQRQHRPDEQSGEAGKRTAKMLEALGGRGRWARLKSLYIRATHTEKAIPKPYKSEIWRNFNAVNGTRLKIVQGNADFYNERYVDGAQGWLVRGIGGEARELPASQLADLLRSDKYLIYRTIRKIALAPANLVLKIDERDRLAVYEDGQLIGAMELDAQNRPSKYYIPRADGTGENMTFFTQWGKTDGYVHPVVIEPQPSDAIYRIDEWKPSCKPSTAGFAPEKALNERPAVTRTVG